VVTAAALLTAVVLAMTGHVGARVSCDADVSVGQAYTDVPAAHVYLAPWVCLALARVHGGRRSDLAAEAAFVLAHEARHVDGDYRESWADCYGLETMGTVLVLAGMTPARAQAVSAAFRASPSPSGYPPARGCQYSWGKS
jgi:hypothetical protein